MNLTGIWGTPEGAVPAVLFHNRLKSETNPTEEAWSTHRSYSPFSVAMAL